MSKRVGFVETDPLQPCPENRISYYGQEDEDDDDGPEETFISLKDSGSFTSDHERESFAVERLSMRLLSIPDDDEEQQDRILRESLAFVSQISPAEYAAKQRQSIRAERQAGGQFWTMIVMLLLGMVLLVVALFYVGTKVIGPQEQPLGPYQLVERQEGPDFFNYYTFYEGRDSVGSNGYLMYVSEDRAFGTGLANVTYEEDVLDWYAEQDQEKKSGLSMAKVGEDEATTTTATPTTLTTEGDAKKEPFIYMGSAPTATGPRDSIRLEGKRRFNRGLFIIDVRHMPAGCGVWPAFWLTDEANWPVNGEIDIVEGVNYQSMAKTALHSTKGCIMDDIPAGTMTGGWDTAVGIPDKKTGIPDMTMRYAQNCFVYDPHQWLNQGCVAVDSRDGTLGIPLNEKGGGVYALEWDPAYRHMKAWVFTPHKEVPDNLRDAIRTANLPENQRIMPDPNLWPLPYGYFAIGQGTNCPSDKFKNMRLVFNLAFCGSVSGNRFQLDCPAQAKEFSTCNEYVASQPDELNEAYWKVRGVFVYERTWERAWMN